MASLQVEGSEGVQREEEEEDEGRDSDRASYNLRSQQTCMHNSVGFCQGARWLRYIVRAPPPREACSPPPRGSVTCI